MVVVYLILNRNRKRAKCPFVSVIEKLTGGNRKMWSRNSNYLIFYILSPFKAQNPFQTQDPLAHLLLHAKQKPSQPLSSLSNHKFQVDAANHVLFELPPFSIFRIDFEELLRLCSTKILHRCSCTQPLGDTANR